MIVYKTIYHLTEIRIDEVIVQNMNKKYVWINNKKRPRNQPGYGIRYHSDYEEAWGYLRSIVTLPREIAHVESYRRELEVANK